MNSAASRPRFRPVPAVFRLFVLALAAASALLAAPPAFEIQSGQLVVPGPVVFEAGSDRIDAKASAAALAHVKAFLAAKEDITVLRIEAHLDDSAGVSAARKLTEQRALAVGRWLVGQGVDCKRVLPVGFGSSKPVAANSTPAGRAENRRVVFAPAALRGRPIGGLPLNGGGNVAGDLCR
jgi:OOP family OmpA-OmpF porin